MTKYILGQHSPTKKTKVLKKIMFHSLFCYSQRNENLNTVTKQMSKKNAVSEWELFFKDKHLRSST